MLAVRVRVRRVIVPLAAARIDPADPGAPVGAVLALPDRDTGFDSVDERATREERFRPMGRARDWLQLMSALALTARSVYLLFSILRREGTHADAGLSDLRFKKRRDLPC